MIGYKWEKAPANEISNDNEDTENVPEQTEKKGGGRETYRFNHRQAWKLNALNKTWLADR